MADVEQAILRYISDVMVMQLATSQDDQPWACNVHFYADDSLNLYWLSTEAREHSRQLAANPNAAATLMVHANTPEENYIIGVSFAGTAECLGPKVDDTIRSGYQTKHATSDKFLDSVADGSNPHKWYVLRPSKIVLFDTKNFPDDPRQEWSPSHDA